MLLFGKNSKRAKMIEEADAKFNKFREEIKDVPLELSGRCGRYSQSL